MKNYLREYLRLFLIAGTVVLLDQWTKMLIRANLPLGGTWLPGQLEWLAPYARIVHWYNTGAAFGLFQGGSMVFTFLAIIVIGIIIFYYPQISSQDWWLRLALGLQLGGAMGNLLDRLTQGHVTDFISVGTFPVFNIADSSISVGSAVLILGVWLKERAEKRKITSDAVHDPANRNSLEDEGRVQGG